MEVVRLWRNQKDWRQLLKHGPCPHCGNVFIRPHAVCPECNKQLNAYPEIKPEVVVPDKNNTRTNPLSPQAWEVKPYSQILYNQNTPDVQISDTDSESSIPIGIYLSTILLAEANQV